MKKVVLVTGASSGIGRDTAIKLNDRGYLVYGAARRLDRLDELVPMGINVLPLDVTDDGSMVKCVSSLVEKEGGIDVLVNCAGYGSCGAVEDVPMEEARRQFEVNVFGLARMTQLVLPYMRDRHSGTIVNISSIAGKMASPMGAWYYSAKHAVEGLSDSLRMEVQDFGINVVIIEPGLTATAWGIIAADSMMKESGGGAYSALAKKLSDRMYSYYRTQGRITSASVISALIVKAVEAKHPRARYVGGTISHLTLFTRRLLCDRSFDRVIRKFTC
ncbi:MAG: oxidoreductase [Bacteroidales bacterium]|jgi:short-subunit dehydrogenase|nr:oxidoreductase [Bacteroidales bacterium]MCI2122027.1 oxidoreductase [Bacteroidales bacterium]MCI2146218.1 oxidoreductase [Bacteroidales bacterium]